MRRSAGDSVCAEVSKQQLEERAILRCSVVIAFEIVTGNTVNIGTVCNCIFEVVVAVREIVRNINTNSSCNWSKMGLIRVYLHYVGLF